MPLPFRTRPCLPDNRRVAMRRADHVERRFRSNDKYHQDYKAFMEGMLERGDAEKIPLDELGHKPSWYIPHHGIYHPNKPDKIRVIFDCRAKCQGTSLNDHLLKGPDLTNGLTGVSIRFREERVAFMCDVEKMFHQFRVDTQDRNYLRFLWMGEDYRMRVHLFGASSSPACANYGLKQIANDSPGATHFVRRNFYVDDRLKSVDSIDKAKNLITQTREMCANLRRATSGFTNSFRTVSKCLNRFLVQNVLQTSRIWIWPWNTCLSKEHLGSSGALNRTASSFDLRSRIARARAVVFCPRLPLFTTPWESWRHSF